MAVNVSGLASGGAMGNSGVLDAVSESLGGLGKAIAALGVAATGPTAAIIGMGQVLSGFVAKANPAVFEQFTLAMNDMMAVIGQALVPIFQTVVIPVVRAAADALTQLAPAGAALAAALEPLIGLIGDAFAGAMGILAEAVRAAAPVILAFGSILRDVVRFVSNGVRELLSLVGIDLPGAGVKAGASVGAAARQASHMDPTEAVRAAQRSAFSLGTASGDPMGKMADAMAATRSEAAAIKDFITNRLPQLIMELPRKIAEAAREFGSKAEEFGRGAIAGGLNSPAATVASALPGGFMVDVARRAERFGEQTRPVWSQPVRIGGYNLNPFGG